MISLKIDIISSDELVIYLFNNVNDYNFKDEIHIEECLRKLFKKMNEYYNIKLKGFYNVNVYLDLYYGIVLELRKEKIEYYDFLDNQIDMKIIINKNKFLYLVDDYNFNLKNFDVYRLLNNIYLLPKKKLSNYEFANLIENSIIVYKSEDIIRNGIKLYKV